MRLLVAVAAICTLSTASTLKAQRPRPFKLGVGGGATFLGGDDRVYWRDGYNVVGSVAVDVPTLAIGVRADVAYHRLGGKNKSTQQVPGGPDTLYFGDFSVLSGTVNAIYRLGAPMSAVRPFISAGMGVYRSETKATLYGQPVTGADTHFGVSGALGLSAVLGGRHAFVEARVHNLFYSSGSARLYPVTAGVLF